MTIVTAPGLLTKPLNPLPIHLRTQARDDLTAIKGIGPARQRWLREIYHVQTFADLAGLSLDEIEAQLKAMGQVVSRRRIDHWLVDARQRAAGATPVPFQQSGVFRIRGAAKPAPPHSTDGSGSQGAWRPFASFVVELQAHRDAPLSAEKRTKVHHIETDTCATWPGIVSEQLCQWMMAQLGDEFQASLQLEAAVPVSPSTTLSSRKASFPTTPAPQPFEAVQMTQIQLLQPPTDESSPTVGPAGQPFPAFVKGDMPFRLEVTIAVNGLVRADIAPGQVAVHLQTHVYDLSTGVTRLLSDMTTGLLLEDEAIRKILLPVTSLTPGVYRLQLRATLESTPPIIARATVPLFQAM